MFGSLRRSVSVLCYVGTEPTIHVTDHMRNYKCNTVWLRIDIYDVISVEESYVESKVE